MKGEFYKMDYDAWDVGTVDLTLEQEAAYLRLCNQMYRTKGPIPYSTRLLQGLFRCGHTRAKALAEKLIAAGKIQVTAEGLLSNERVLAVLSERNTLSDKRREAAGGGRISQPETDPTPTKPRANTEQPPTRDGPNHQQHTTNTRATPHKSLINNNVGGAITSDMSPREEERRGEQSSYACAREVHPNPDAEMEAALRRASGLEKDPSPGLMVLGPIHDLLADGYDLERHILPVLRALKASGKTWRTWSYVLAPVREKNARSTARGRAGAPPSPANSETYLAGVVDERWRTEIERWKHTAGAWGLTHYTPPPDDPRTKVPQRFLDEYGIRPWTPPPDVRMIDRVSVAA